MTIERDERDQALALHRVISEVDPDLRNAFTAEEANRVIRGGEKVEKKEKTIKTVSLKGSIELEKAPRVARLVEDEHYYRLLIGERKAMRGGKQPPRQITICKEELPALKELFAAV